LTRRSIVLFVVAVSLGGAELGARFSGRQPRSAIPRPEPVLHAPDAVLGWKPAPGSYVLGPHVTGGDRVTMTILPDGARANGAPAMPDRPTVALIGCSFTIGWAVADGETWGARLHGERPDLGIVNRGVAGYGTYQSLLVLEQLLVDRKRRPAWVLYGDIGHDLRNIGSLAWLGTLAETRDMVAAPYATLRPNGAIRRHAPQRYPALPLHEHLASVALVEHVWARWRVRDRAGTSPRRLTERLLLDMAALAKRSGVGFSVVVLTLDEHVRRARLAFAAQHRIDVIDCNQRLSPTLTIPGDGHPNARAHQQWGDCVAKAMSQPQRLPPAMPPP
jgi:hypothetical protein